MAPSIITHVVFPNLSLTTYLPTGPLCFLLGPNDSAVAQTALCQKCCARTSPLAQNGPDFSTRTTNTTLHDRSGNLGSLHSSGVALHSAFFAASRRPGAVLEDISLSFFSMSAAHRAAPTTGVSCQQCSLLSANVQLVELTCVGE